MNCKSMGALVLALACALLPRGVSAQDDAEVIVIAPGPSSEAILTVHINNDLPSPDQDLEAEFQPTYSAVAPVEWTFTIISRHSAPESRVWLRIYDLRENPLYEGSMIIPLVPGENPVRFVVPVDELEEGYYGATVSVEVEDERVSPVLDLSLNKTSPAQVARDLKRLEEELLKTAAHLEGIEDQGVASPYSHMRVGIATGVWDRAGDVLAMGDWRLAGEQLGYVDRALSRVKGELTFAGKEQELLVGIPEPDMSELRIVNGGFVSNGRPVFLAGVVGSEDLIPDMKYLRSIGLNHTVLSIPPSETDWLAEGLAAARANNLNVTAVIAPEGERGTAWLRETDQVLPQVNASVADVQTRAEAVRNLVQLLDSVDNVNSLAFAIRPRFMFEGETVREAFIAFLRERYEDREALNRSWKARLRDFEDAQLYADLPRPSFRFDQASFLQSLAARYVEETVANFRRVNPDLALEIVFSDKIFVPGSPLSTVNHEWLSQVLDITGAYVGAPRPTEYYALDHPRNTMLYVLLNSLAPNSPTVNPVLPLVHEVSPEGDFGFRFAHATVWDSAMAGLDGIALAAGDGGPEILSHPDALEGFATAALDLQRLGELVTAFQSAPADIAIMWSMASQTYEGGEPYLDSLVRAYEGASFAGRKVRFISEQQCVAGELAGVRVLVIPQMAAMSEAAFSAVQAYIEAGGAVVRPGNPIPYDEWGHSRSDVIGYTVNTVLLRGVDDPTNYLHAMETQYAADALTQVPRAVNSHGYLLEGVKSRYLEWNGEQYLFLLNIRKNPVVTHIAGDYTSGRDLIHGVDVSFPQTLKPLTPLLLRLAPPEEGVPTEVVTPITAQAPVADVRRTGAR